MRAKIVFIGVIVLCCLCHTCGGYVSTNLTETATPSCRVDEEIISFSEVYLTGAAFLGQRVKCRGVLEKIKYGPLGLKPVEGEFRNEEHIVHANKWKFIGIHRCKGIERCCLCNEDETSWQGMDGKKVIVEGVLSDSSPSCSMASEEFMSPVLLDCRIKVDSCLPDTNNVVTNKKQRISFHQQVSSGCEYESPCREFKLTVHTANGGRYMIHFYSAVLWMAYVDPDRVASIMRPFPLYPRIENKRRLSKVWTMLNELEKQAFQSANNSHRSSVKRRAKRYSQIPITEIHDPQVELIDAVRALFDFVSEQQRQKD